MATINIVYQFTCKTCGQQYIGHTDKRLGDCALEHIPQIQESKGDVTITNDGATILKQMKLLHPAAKMVSFILNIFLKLVELSRAQDIETGDGTTTVVVLAGSLLDACQKLLDKGLHPTRISDAFRLAASKACEVLESMSIPVDLSNNEVLLKAATTALNSKVVSQYSSSLAPLAVRAVLEAVDPASPDTVSLNDIRMVKKIGGTVEDTELIDGLILTQHTAPGGVKRVEKMENNIIITDYTQMDRVMKEERQYILNIVKAVKNAGCNVLLIQKSILRDAINDLALHYFAKMNIMVVKDIERSEIEFISKTLNCTPMASLDHVHSDCLGSASLVEESDSTARCVKITGIQNKGKTVSILIRGSNKLVIDEAERSLHDALCVIRCLVKKKAMIAGGGAPEIEISQKLYNFSNTTPGLDQYCLRAFADAFEVIPYTLAENAGLNPVRTVTELRSLHAHGKTNAGIYVRAGAVPDILTFDVMQPLLVSYSAVTLGTEIVRAILKIDDVESGDWIYHLVMVGGHFCYIDSCTASTIHIEVSKVMFVLRDKIKNKQSGTQAAGSDAAQSPSVRSATIRDRLLLQELPELEKHLPPTCKVSHPDANKLHEFTLTVHPEDCVWSGGTFTFDISVPEGYNHVPPQVTCKTKIWHPNIDEEGRVCLSVLRQSSLDSTGWSPTRRLLDVIWGIGMLFNDLCDFNDPLNTDAASQHRNDPEEFNRRAREYVHRYAR